MRWESDFAHLHVASWYSLRYGVARPAALVARAAELGMPALALTDRDGLYGAVKHAVSCAEAGIAPILGADMALRPPRPGRAAVAAGPPRLHNEDASRVTLLAVGGRGWASLCRLVSAAHGAAHRSGNRGAPAVTPDMVAAHTDGLVVLLGPASDAGRAIAARRPDLAAAAVARWRERAETVIEIADHHAPGTTFRAARMLGLARDLGVPAVLTNAVRYLDMADGPVAQVLDAARRLRTLRRGLSGGRAYLASGAEMAEVAARICGTGHRGTGHGGTGYEGTGRGGAGDGGDGEVGRLLADTARLARRCALAPKSDLGIGGRFLPETAGEPMALLRARCEEGLDRRFPPGRTGRGAARHRLEHELGIIARTELAPYFLTVADVAGEITSHGIRCSIRGSGAGCLVNYLIGISSIDPIVHDLVMERFLSQGREGLPDIDLDVESARRIEAYRLIIGVYGEQRIACVSMAETYRARSAIGDVAATLGLPRQEAGAIAKGFGHIRAAHIGGALAELPEMRASGLAIPQLATVYRLAERLDGLPRHIAMHPCGVVLSDASLLDRSPVERSIEDLPLSQFDKDDVELAGMIKLDVLGVRMQSAMAHTVAEVARTGGGRVDIDAISHHDEATFELIRSSRTLGCFQIESPGQRELLGRLQPRHIGDLIVEISLFRPGPVNSDMITPYTEVRHGRQPPCYPHEDLAGALAETGGVVVFHEQVLRIIDTMTGCGLSHAELVRRQLSDGPSREPVAEWFRRKALRRGYDGEIVDRVWEVLAAFGAFGFCKAHAAAFAVPTYQSAWLKRHHPAAFYAGILTHDPGMYPKRVLVGDARLLGVPILPADVNACAADWRVERVTRPGVPPAQGLRPGLREVKGISDAEVARLVAGQPYTSLRDFWERAGVSRPVTERLVMVGAFASLYSPGARPVSRRDLLARVGVLSQHPRPAPRRRAPATRREGCTGQLPLDLGGPGRGGDGVGELVRAGELRELTADERVQAELEVLGIDLSQHVLSFYDGLLAELGVVRAAGLRRCQPGAQVLVAGVKVATQTPAVRSGQRIIFATLDDATGLVDLAFFESVQEHCAARLFGSWLLVAAGQVRRVGTSVTVNGTRCWDLQALAGIHERGGIRALRAQMAAGAPGSGAGRGPRPSRMVFPNGFALSAYAETGTPGAALKNPPARLWHASPGSSGGTGDVPRARGSFRNN
jgi:error-prone DNA polymerase